jgi:hypothetical protein
MHCLTETVWAASIAPASRKMIALQLAKLHDSNNGLIEISMKVLAAQAALSTNQARTHVHGLISDGVLAVTANAHGGAPSQVPRYRFCIERIAALSEPLGCTPDLFDAVLTPSPALLPSTSGVEPNPYIFRAPDGREFEATMIGSAGRRAIIFWLPGPRARRHYGSVRLNRLLHKPGSPQGWDGVLCPAGSPTFSESRMVVLGAELVLNIALWAQTAALGRAESPVTP